jgi:hypothetical protein
MANRRAKRSHRREELSDPHVVVEDRDSEEGKAGVASPHQDRLDRLRYVEEDRDPEVLATNLRRLVQRKGVTRRQVWTAIGEKERAWFERVLKRGLSKVTPKGRDRLEKLARYFKATYDDLWRPDLTPSRSASRGRRFRTTPRTLPTSWPAASTSTSRA